MIKSFGNLLAVLAIVGMALPLHAADAPATRMIQDVKLTKDNLLLGIVIGSAGQPESNAVVRISHDEKVVATVKTDAKGRYAVRGLRAGVHTVRTAHSQSTCRFWTAQTAPPTAKTALINSHNEHIVRGQSGEGIGGVLLPLGLFAAVAAVTIVTTTDDDDEFIVTPPASP